MFLVFMDDVRLAPANVIGFSYTMLAGWGVDLRFDNASSQVTAEQEKPVELVKGGYRERKERGGTLPGQVPTSAEALGGLAPHWVFLYQRLATEGDRRVRRMTAMSQLDS